MGGVLALVDAFLIVAFGLILGFLGHRRFEALERRLDRHEERTEARFERFDRRFERLEERFASGLEAVRADVTQLALTLVPPREAGQS